MSTLAEIEAPLFVAGEDGIRVRQLAEGRFHWRGFSKARKLAHKYEKDQDSSLALIETEEKKKKKKSLQIGDYHNL